MNATRPDSGLPPTELGNLLRYWRDVRGRSQLDLSLEAGVSQRQISFIESGRSVPGRDTLLTLAQTLDVPMRERNALLLAAGYAPMYSEAPWNAQEMQGVIRALDRVVRQHEPFPAIVMDRRWDVLMSNEAAPRFFNHFIDLAAREGPRNMLHLIFDPRGMRPFVADWDSVAQPAATGASRIGRPRPRRRDQAPARRTAGLPRRAARLEDASWAIRRPHDARHSNRFRQRGCCASLFLDGDDRGCTAERRGAGVAPGMHVSRR